MISKLITASGLNMRDTIKISESLMLYTADYIHSDKTICKYLFLSGDSASYKEKIVNKDNYKIFEESLIEPIFFKLIGDLSWNLYLVFVLSEAEYKNLALDEIIEFEKDERYARKIVLSREAFLRYIPVGKVVKSESTSYIVDPVTEWMAILESKNMTFCLDSYSKLSVQSFLNGNVQPETYTDVSPTEENSILGSDSIKIKGLNINGNFRKHCFNSNLKFEFGDVNLLSGANGSGKTSVLEAIELIMTGEIRKNSKGCAEGQLYKNDLNSNSTLVLTDGKEVVIPNDYKVKKERESALYQNRQKKKDNLNGGFHQYNYYTFEDTYTFCFLGQQPNYSDEFSKIIFGESTKTIERNWTRYKEAFEKEIELIDKDLSCLKGELELLGQIDNVDTQFSLSPLYRLLDDVKVNYEKVGSESNYESMSVWLKELQSKLMSMKMLFENFLTQSNGLDSKSSINLIYGNEQEKLIKTQELLSISEKNIDDIELVCCKIRTQIEEKEAKKESINSLSSSLKENLQDFNSYTIVFNNIVESNKLLDFDKERENLQQKIFILSDFEERWGGLFNAQLLDLSVSSLNKQLEDLYINKDGLNERLKSIVSQIEIEESKNESIGSIISQVKVLGKKYFHESTEISKCPLCGTGFDSRIEFMQAIENELIVDESNYRKLLEQRDSLTQEVNTIEKRVELLEVQQGYLEDLHNAIDFITENNLIEIDEIIKNDSTLKMKEKISAVSKLFQSELDRLKKLEVKIRNLEVKGILLSLVQDALKYLNAQTDSNDEYLVSEKVSTLKDKYEKLSGDYAAQISDLDTKREKLKNDLYIELEKAKVTDTTKQKLEADRAGIEASIQKLETLKGYIEEIEEHNITIELDTSISKIKNCLQIILDEDVRLSETITNIIKRNEKLDKHTTTKQNIDFKEQMRTRCTNAITVLDSLKLSEQYAEEFIKNNISDISNLFISLHSPREFDKLDLNINDEIVGFRKTDSADIEVPVYMMSTGQRTAVVLSIFIKLHLSMRTAPKFILLDEPVSNVDDLNILGLLDFLREIAISNGTQIFFTTANHTVAKLFKRKFSFMRDEFHEFKFMRFGNTKSKIIRCTYNEYHDSKVDEVVIS